MEMFEKCYWAAYLRKVLEGYSEKVIDMVVRWYLS